MEEELRASEENFRLLVEGVGDHAILMLDPSGRVVTWNEGAQRIKGWTPEEILGRNFSVFYLPEDIASGKPDRDLERAAAEGRTQSEGWRVRAGGQRFWAETTMSAMRDTDGTLRGFAKVTRDRTENHQARARLESVGELNRAALEQRPDDDLLALVVSRARAMVGRHAGRGLVARRRRGRRSSSPTRRATARPRCSRPRRPTTPSSRPPPVRRAQSWCPTSAPTFECRVSYPTPG